MDITNPFYNVGPIDNASLFFNRKILIETLLSSLFADRPQCISIVGQRKIGKSSLVQHLFRTSTLDSFGRESSRYCPVFFNCQTHINRLTSRESFFQAIVEEIHRQTPLHVFNLFNIEANSDEPYSTWLHLLNAFDKNDYKLIVVFDEFDKAISQARLIHDGVFGNLRGCANDIASFKWITCTSQYLHVLFTEAFDEFNVSQVKRKSESDFYNISPTNVVGLFKDSDISMLITSPLQTSQFKFSKQEIELISKCGGTFPYFAQRVCFHIFNARLREDVNLEEIKNLFLQEAKPIWESYWNRLDNVHQQVLVNIVSHIPNATERAMNYLREMALINTDINGEVKPFSQEFGKYIQAQAESIVPKRASGVRSIVPNKNKSPKKIKSKTVADVLLVAVTKVEVKAIISSFGKRIKRRTIARKVYYDLGKVKDARIFLVQSSSMGSISIGGSLVTINKAIEDISPSAIIMVGIAFGISREKQLIGDILVSERLLSYEPQRVSTNNGRLRTISRGSRIDATVRLIDKFKSGELDWAGANVRFGLILSGEKLVDNIEFRDQLLNLEPESIGGEMEGAGLFVAAHTHKVDWIMVKSICDWADGRKEENKQSSQEIAARNAAQFSLHVLRQGGWIG